MPLLSLGDLTSSGLLVRFDLPLEGVGSCDAFSVRDDIVRVEPEDVRPQSGPDNRWRRHSDVVVGRPCHSLCAAPAPR